MIKIILFVIVFMGFVTLLYFLLNRKNIAFKYTEVLFYYGAKIVMGSLYGYIYKKYYNGDDTWQLNHDSLLQYRRLLQHPYYFFSDLLTSKPVQPEPDLFFSAPTYLKQLEIMLVTKLIAPFNAISDGNYYINLLFFNFITFWGSYYLYKTITENLNRDFIKWPLFLFPPALFWLSGYRAEGLIFLCTSILLYHFSKCIITITVKNVAAIITAWLLEFILRDGFAALLIPPLCCWWATIRFGKKPLFTFLVVYSIFSVIIASSIFFPAPFRFVSRVAQRQHEFLELKGTSFYLPAMDDTFFSLLKTLPYAYLNTFLRPFPWEAKGALQWMAALENLLVLLLMVLTLVFFSKQLKQLVQQPFLLVLVTIAVSTYLLIGLLVPFPGAIVRYKIIGELFLVVTFLIAIAPRLYKTLGLKNKLF